MSFGDDTLDPSNNSPRAKVYRAIDSERAYQDSRWPQASSPDNPNPLRIGEFVLLLEEYAARARAEWTAEKQPEQKTLHFIRKCAGICVNCMEQHGAPQREGFER